MKIFISHSSVDKKFVRTLKDDLKENGFDIWFDEDELHIGDSLLEKILESIEDSSFFLVILSESSILSNWVDKELTKAIEMSKNQEIKILPVKYRNCEVPKNINKMLYWDLSEEVFRINNEKLFFLTEGYDKFLVKLIKSINGHKKLSETAKKKIIEVVDQEYLELGKEENLLTHLTNYYSIIGFKEANNQKYYESLLDKIKHKFSLQMDEFYPIYLPRDLRHFLGDIAPGTPMKIIYQQKLMAGHFIGYRKNDLSITFPREIRRALKLELKRVYVFKIDKTKMTIKIIDEN